MPILVDGNNLMHRLPRDRRNRDGVRQLILDQTRFERITVTVVFDGPPPADRPEKEHLGAVRIQYSGSRTADAVILLTLPKGGAQDWTVVSDDAALTRAAHAHGARTRTLDQWLNRRRRDRRPIHQGHEPKLPANEISMWEEAFSEPTDDGDDEPAIVLRKPRKRR